MAQRKLRIFSWHDFGVDGVQPMAWAPTRWGHTIPPGEKVKRYSDMRPAESAAEEAIPVLEAAPAGERALFLYGIGEANPRMYSPSDPKDGAFDLAHAVETLVHGPRLEPTLRWVSDLADVLAARGVGVDYLVLDVEKGAGYWHFTDPQRVEILRELRRKHEAGLVELPESLLTVELNKPLFHAWPALVYDWGKLSEPPRRVALQRIFDAVAQRFPGLEGSNYSMGRLGWTWSDFNGWVHAAGSGETIGTHASPVLYQKPGQRHDSMTGELLAAAVYADARNECRCHLAGNERVAPWYAWPSYDKAINNRELARRGMLDDIQQGIDVMLLWGEHRHWNETADAKGKTDIDWLRGVVPQFHAAAAARPAEKPTPRPIDFTTAVLDAQASRVSVAAPPDSSKV